MGQIFDTAKIQAAGGEEAFKNLTGDSIESSANCCSSNILPLRGDSSGHSAGRVWSYLDLRQI